LEKPVLLLTGGTGLVGGELLKLLLATKPDRRIVVLTRQRQTELTQPAGITLLHGDITHVDLGLHAHIRDALKRSITEVIHCAADTHFGLSLERAREVNTEGTRKILNFVSDCRQLQKFAYISTLYVVGQSAGHFREGPIFHQSAFSNAYQQSKYEAEELILRAMSKLPAAVFRLSSIIGDSTTGMVRQFNHVHRLIRLFPQNTLPIAPGLPDAPIDLIASDWAIAAVAFLFECAFFPSRFYHICAGPERSLTLREMLDQTRSVFESHPIGRKWMPIRIPKLVSLARYEEFVEVKRRESDRLLNELLKVMGYFVPHLAIFQAFGNADTMRALAPSGLQFPPIRDCYEKVVRFCLDTNWGRGTHPVIGSA